MGNILKIFFILTALVFFTSWGKADETAAPAEIQDQAPDQSQDDVDRQIAEVEQAQTEALAAECKATKHGIKCKNSKTEDKKADEELEFSSSPTADQAKSY